MNNPKPDLKDIGAWIFLDWRRVGANHLRESSSSHGLRVQTAGDFKVILTCTSCRWGYTSNPLGREICGEIQDKWGELVSDPKWFEKF